MRTQSARPATPQAAATRARILGAASRLFYPRGVRSVTLDDVAAEAGVTKVTVYQHFSSKDALIAACLHTLDDRYFEWFVREVEKRADDPRERLLAVFDVFHDWIQGEGFRGCFFINSTVELADPNHPGHAAIRAHKARSRTYFRALAEQAAVADAAALADQWVLLTEGATISALVEDDREAARRAGQAARILLAAAGA